MIERLYKWTMDLAAKKGAVWWLAAISFIESSFFPIPPDILLIPIILANRARAAFVVAVCTIASVAGGLFGYAIGFFLFDTVGQPLLDFYGYAEKFGTFQQMYNENGGWIVFGAGLTPFPYKVITIASGVTQLDLTTFVIASVIARGMRFALLGVLLWWAGPRILPFIEKNLGLLTIVFFVLLIGGFAAIRLF
ncbi:MAG: YqaA family protein [Pseudomonadota bacterium]